MASSSSASSSASSSFSTAGRLSVPTPSGEAYHIHIQPGSLDDLGVACREHAPAHRYALISDAGVADLYGSRALRSLSRAGCSAELFVFPGGESHKSRASWAGLTDDLLAAGYGRDSVVVALGGGVTGDLAGFVAATFMRGVPVVQVPTSLLAMLDSSVGGKTGVDTRSAKNSVGAFHHPALVWIDPGLLETLPERQRLAGLAEAVKAATVKDAGLFGWIERRAGELRDGSADAIATIVRRAVEIKAEIVTRDPSEQGCRAILNFGHTLGHAVESLSGYTVLHGEAVALGMCLEISMGEIGGLTSPGEAARIAELLRGLGLEVDPKAEHTAERLLAGARGDKKARAGVTRWVVLERLGSVRRDADGSYTHAIPAADAADWLRRALLGCANEADSLA